MDKELPAAHQRIAELEEQVNDYAGVRDQANWQSEQDAQAVWERDQMITELKEQVEHLKDLRLDVASWRHKAEELQGRLREAEEELNSEELNSESRWAHHYCMRLKEAEGLLDRSRIALVAFMEGTLVNDINLMDDLNAATQATEPVMRILPPEKVAAGRAAIARMVENYKKTTEPICTCDQGDCQIHYVGCYGEFTEPDHDQS